MCGEHFPDRPFLQQLTYAVEVGKVAPIVGHKTRAAHFCGDMVDAKTVGIAGGKWLFYVNGLAGFKCMIAKMACVDGGVAI